nr:NAD(P)/FAD-dependent oxidoreductase [Dictyobacter formicarum]
MQINKITPNDKQASTRQAENAYVEGVTVLFGTVSFLSPTTLLVNDEEITTHTTVIATGSRPAVPDIEGLAAVGYWTNEDVFQLTALPPSIIVAGGGPVGVELGQALGRLGVQVTLLQGPVRILPKEDPEVSAALASVLVSGGIRLETSARVVKVYRRDSRKVVVAQQGDRQVTFEADEILLALGRQPNGESLNVEAAGVAYDARGINVNAYLQTANNAIYACGDVIGGYRFTHVAAYQAGVAVRNALLPVGKKKVDYRVVPWCTFTDPEVARVGLTIEQARRQYRQARVVTFPWAEIDRAQTEDEPLGLLQFVLTGKQDEIVGAHLVALTPTNSFLLLFGGGPPTIGVGINGIAWLLHPLQIHWRPGHLVPADVRQLVSGSGAGTDEPQRSSLLLDHLPDIDAVRQAGGQIADQELQRHVKEIDPGLSRDTHMQGMQQLRQQHTAPDLGSQHLRLRADHEAHLQIVFQHPEAQLYVPSPRVQADNIGATEHPRIPDITDVGVPDAPIAIAHQAHQMLTAIGAIFAHEHQRFEIAIALHQDMFHAPTAIAAHPTDPPDARVGQAIKPGIVVVSQIKEQQGSLAHTFDHLFGMGLTIGHRVGQQINAFPLLTPDVKQTTQASGQQLRMAGGKPLQIRDPTLQGIQGRLIQGQHLRGKGSERAVLVGDHACPQPLGHLSTQLLHHPGAFLLQAIVDGLIHDRYRSERAQTEPADQTPEVQLGSPAPQQTPQTPQTQQQPGHLERASPFLQGRRGRS